MKKGNGATAPSVIPPEFGAPVVLEGSPTKKTRKPRAKYECRVEFEAMMEADGQVTSTGEPMQKPVGSGIYDTANFIACDDLESGLKSATEDAKSRGTTKYRVIHVLREFTVQVETVKAAKIV